MIVRPVKGEVRLITQHDHARAAGTLARRWVGGNALPPLPGGSRKAFYFAVDNHDVGWCRHDASPRLDPATNLPFSFFGTTAEEATEIWTEGVAFCEAHRPFAGYMVSVHFCTLAEAGLSGAPPEELGFLQKFVRAEHERQAALVRCMSGEENACKEKAAFLLRACDTLSLLACRAPEIMPPEGRTHPLAGSGLRVRSAGGDTLEVGPWPFDAESLSLRFPGLTIQRGRFESGEDLEEALRVAEPAVYVSLLTPLRN